MAKNVQGVIFLRNNNPYESRELARQGIVTNSGSLIDGEFILARYTSNDEVKTLVGVIYVNGDQRNVTIIDMDKASSDVDDLRREINAKLGEGVSSANTVTAQLTALSGNSSTDTSATTSVEGAKKYAKDYTDEQISGLDYTGITTGDGVYVANVVQTDGKISATAATLPTVETITVAGKPIIAVAEDKGTIAASAGTIDAQYVDVTGFTATDVQGALEEVKANIGEAISGLDYSDTAVPGEYVSEVDEVDGVISVTRVALPSSADTAVAKKVVIAVAEDKGQITVSRGELSSSAQTLVLTDNEDGGVNFEANIDNSTIVQDETTKKLKVASAALTQYVGDENTIHISAVDTATNTKTINSLLTIQKVTTGLSEEVKEEYHLVGSNGVKIGDPVQIYKDSHIVSINYITTGEHAQNLEYVYVDVSGNTQTTYVDMSELVLETEFASGVTVTDGIAHGVVDPTSETFLTVGEDGFKLAGVQDAIDDAIEALDATGGTQTIATGKHVAVEVVEKDGKITAVTVVEDNIADADDLAQEILDRTSGDTELSSRLGTGVTTANTATAQLIALSGNTASTSADTSVEGAKRYADEKVAEATADLTELSAKTVTEIGSSNASISAVSAASTDGTVKYDIVTDADKIQMSGFSADATSSLSGIAESDSIATAFEKTNAVITENERVTAAALNNLRTDVDTVSGDVETISDDVETISGNVETISGNVETISGDVNTIKTNYVSGVSVNGHAVTVANHVAPISISGSTAAATPTSTEAIVVDTDANGNVTLGLGIIDCGTYDIA